LLVDGDAFFGGFFCSPATFFFFVSDQASTTFPFPSSCALTELMWPCVFFQSSLLRLFEETYLLVQMVAGFPPTLCLFAFPGDSGELFPPFSAPWAGWWVFFRVIVLGSSFWGPGDGVPFRSQIASPDIFFSWIHLVFPPFCFVPLPGLQSRRNSFCAPLSRLFGAICDSWFPFFFASGRVFCPASQVSPSLELQP